MVQAGGGRLAGGYKGLSKTGLIHEMCNVGWILLELGSRSLTADGLMILAMEKGPINQGTIFLAVSFS